MAVTDGDASSELLARVAGPVRLGTRTKDLVKALRPGEIAVIGHRNIDRIAAEDLASSGVAAVLNTEPSSDDRYPNRGPLILAEAGVMLVDFPGVDLFSLLSDGDRVVVDGGTLLRDGDPVAEGVALGRADLARRLSRQEDEIHVALAEFAENTVTHVRRESEILTGDIALPEIQTSFRDRHVLIVVRGPDYRSDLRALDAYIRDVKPVLIGVDGGADAIIDAGHRPSMILGDMDSATDRALSSGAELVVHAYPDGRAPGRDRLTSADLDHVVFPADGTSQDVAMLLAHEMGAEMIVSVGAHFNLVEFLDKDRDGMSSTFLTRLRIGETLVDAKGVSRLYSPGVPVGPLVAFLGAFVLLAVIVVLTSPALADLFELIWLKVKVSLGF
jgi:uncharacterized membrane-anchored protein